ncbi:MAG: hypothetical protein HY237_01280, partial [Acidobacteria bacterium]|nr:hypothetical protein [Acidobacteriota bacterium]
PPEEKPAFGYDPGAIDWWEYWINIHIPALRRWCYPLIEGRAPETRAAREFHLPEPSRAAAAASTASLSEAAPRSKATWPSS